MQDINFLHKIIIKLIKKKE